MVDGDHTKNITSTYLGMKSQKKKSEKPNNINPFILEVTKKGIKLHKNDVTHFQTAIAKVINFIPDLLDRTATNPWSNKRVKSILGDINKGEVEDNAVLKLLASLDIVWPEEIICLHCTEGVVPLCENCNEGYITCDNCGGNWDQECGECGGDGDWDCDECDGGRFRCDACEGDGQIDCDHCDGKGEDTCGACAGKGCDECKDEDSSEGTIPCEDCDGDGTISCDNCDSATVISSVIIVGEKATFIVSIVKMADGIVRTVMKGVMDAMSVMVIGWSMCVLLVEVKENGMKKIQKYLLN